MKSGVKKITKILCFILGLCIILGIISFIIKPDSNIYNYTAVENKTESYLTEQENTIDVIFIGDSETYSSFSPLHIWNKTGITSYVMGMSGQRLCDTYELLKRSVDKQEIKLVMLETNCIYRNSTTYDVENNDMVMNKVGDVFPVFKYHSRWKQYVPGALEADNVKEERKFKGFRVRFGIEPYEGGEWMIETDAVKEFPKNNAEYLGKIKNFCDERGIKFVLISSPSPDCWDYERHNGVSAWADANAVEFIDMNLMHKDLKIDWLTDTKDEGNHLNYFGAVKVSDYISGYLQDNYDFKDRREDSNCEEWNACYKEYYKKVKNRKPKLV